MRDLPPLPPTHTRPMKLNTLVTLMVYSVTGAILLVIFCPLFCANYPGHAGWRTGYCPRGGQNPGR